MSREPVVREANSDNNSPALIADLAVRGVWSPQTEALFDIRVVDTDAQSYCGHAPLDVLTTAEREKKLKYRSACEERRAIFTPLCVSVDGLLGNEAKVFVKRLAEGLSQKWEDPTVKFSVGLEPVCRSPFSELPFYAFGV